MTYIAIGYDKLDQCVGFNRVNCDKVPTSYGCLLIVAKGALFLAGLVVRGGVQLILNFLSK